MTSKEGQADQRLPGDEVQQFGWVASSPNWEPTAEEIRRSAEDLADIYSRPGPKLPPLTEVERIAKLLPTTFVRERRSSVRVLPADPWGWTNLVR